MPNEAYIIIIFSCISFMVNLKKNSLYIFIKNYVWSWKTPLLSFELSAYNWNCPRTFMSTLGNNWTTSLFGAGNGVRISEIKLIGTNVAHFLCPLVCSFFYFLFVFFFSGGTVVQGRPSDFFWPRATDLQLDHRFL